MVEGSRNLSIVAEIRDLIFSIHFLSDSLETMLLRIVDADNLLAVDSCRVRYCLSNTFTSCVQDLRAVVHWLWLIT